MNELQLVDALVERGDLPSEERAAVIEALIAPPERDAWSLFLYLAGQGFGVALVLSGVLYLVAFNWDELGIFSKEAFVFATLLTASGVAIVRGPTSFVGQLGSAAAAVLAGSGLVIYSQVYQSGANAWQLFAMWTLLAAPFVLAARTPPLWTLFIVLVDTTFLTWLQNASNEAQTLWATGLALAHIALSWLWAGQWLQQVLRVGAFLVLLPIAAAFAYEQRDLSMLPAFLLVGIGGVAVEIGYGFGIAGSAAATLGCVGLVSLVFAASLPRFNLFQSPNELTLLAIGFELAVLCVVSFVWLIGMPRLRHLSKVSS